MHAIRNIAWLGVIVLAGNGLRAADVDAHLPADTDVVISVNVDRLLKSPLGNQYLRGAIDGAIKNNANVQIALTALGLDPTRDISSVTAAMSSASPEQGLIVVHGKFDAAKINDLAEKAAAIQPDKIKIHKTDNGVVYEIADDKKVFAAIPDSSTLIMSTDRDRLSATGGKVKKELASLIAKADGKQGLWFVALPQVTKAIPAMQDDQKKLLDQLQGIVGMLKVESSLKFELNLISQSPQSAAATQKMVDGWISLAKLYVPNLADSNPKLSPVVDIVNSLHSAVRKKSVSVSFELSAEQVEKTIKLLHEDK